MTRSTSAVALLLLVAAGAQADSGSVAGTVRLAVQDVQLADLGPTVVFLDAADLPAAPRRAAATIRQKNAHFSPEFLSIAAGQAVRMPNDDAIFHNVFSYSKPNDFDLGLYPAGESRTVAFRSAGLVKIYCSIHESMNATVFVSPSPWFADVDAEGRYEIRNVPPGRYRVRTWNERLAEVERPVTVRGGGRDRVDLSLGNSEN